MYEYTVPVQQPPPHHFLTTPQHSLSAPRLHQQPGCSCQKKNWLIYPGERCVSISFCTIAIWPHPPSSTPLYLRPHAPLPSLQLPLWLDNQFCKWLDYPAMGSCRLGGEEGGDREDEWYAIWVQPHYVTIWVQQHYLFSDSMLIHTYCMSKSCKYCL